jgi:hypothetical protein
VPSYTGWRGPNRAPRLPPSFGSQIGAMRQTIADVMRRETAGAAVLDVEQHRQTEMAVQAATALRSTQRQLVQLRNIDRLLALLEQGGQPETLVMEQGET